MLVLIERAGSAVAGAQKGYQSLLDRFPRSIPLLRSYSVFCDTVANRHAEAIQLRELAESLEYSSVDNAGSENASDTGEQMARHISVYECWPGTAHHCELLPVRLLVAVVSDWPGAAAEGRVGGGGEKSETSGTSENGPRARMDKFFASWRDHILGQDLMSLHHLDQRILCAIVLVAVVSTAGFCLMDIVLYGSMANSILGLLANAGDFRPDSANMIYIIRSMFLAAYSRDMVTLGQLRSALVDLSTSNGAQHLSNFESCPSGFSKSVTLHRCIISEKRNGRYAMVL